MAKSRCWCAFLSVLILLAGAGSVRAVEYGKLVQKDGKWVFQSTEDPVLKLMQAKGVITNEEYIEAAAQTGINWKETADAVLILERDQMEPVSQDSNAFTQLGGSGHRKSDAV